jgi:sulfide:quinone oxidoreductase
VAPDAKPFRVLVAGGGIAALEAMLALRELVGDRAELAMLAPADELTLKPLAVGEAFGLAAPPPLPLDTVARDLGAERHRDTLAAVDPESSTVRTGSGESLRYDALLLAVGAHSGDALAGAITYRGGPDNDRVAAVLDELERGSISRVVFAVPQTVQWALPIYELALLTAARAGKDGGGASVALVTYEHAPLSMFGHRASESVAALLREAGIELVAGARAAQVWGAGLTLADGRVIDGDRVISAPKLTVPPLEGVPQDPDGFIDVDARMRVTGLDRVYAAGDATWFPIKQGGIAAQQADAAAGAIAGLIDPGIEPPPFRPTLRGVLFTGGAPRYLRAEVDRRAASSAAGTAPLWWPPSKIAGRHQASYIAATHDLPQPLQDLEPIAGEGGEDDGDQDNALQLALTAADADAREGDHRGALRWLEVAESINIALPDEYAQKRREWSEQQGD